ncbi:hypothetical protein KUCAC02_027901 [Chaenocephalus aceratus]|uniref:Uncharacterized protein n=1 Tax=Chaenocephalus aceratus TaxID=36190 RepID=A0ACB9X0V6_CHAAC|nr:hypothetical protein KUCAC02_027901 [Chaenocephalus aceratus]
MEHPVFRRAPNGTLLLKATAEASTLAPRRAAGQAPYRAKKPEEVDAEAWAHVSSEGGSTAIATLSPLMANKDAFTRYSSAYPDFLEAVRFHRAFEEARAKSLLPGQEGQALVGFGDFTFETLDSLYESVDPKQIRFVNYLRRKIPTPGTQMENAMRYTKSRDRQRPVLSVTQLSSRAELGPCNVAQRQPPGRGHLQPALPSPPRGHAVRRDHEDSVVPHPHGLRGH